MEPLQPEVAVGNDGQAIFKGLEGIPFRARSGAKAPDIKKDDPKQPFLTVDAHVEIFDLTDPNHVAKYQKIWDDIAKGRCVLSMEQVEHDPTTKSWRVLIRYGRRFWEMPE